MPMPGGAVLPGGWRGARPVDPLCLHVIATGVGEIVNSYTRAVPPAVATGTIVRHPVIVIGIPAYNEERHLGRALRSLQAQTFGDFAVLVGDNASADRTGEMAAAVAANDPRFHYHRHASNVGSAANFNFLLESSDSPLFMWLGAHDYIDPSYLQQHVAAMQTDRSLAVSYSNCVWVGEDEQRFRVTTSENMDKVPNIPLIRAMLTLRQIDDYCAEVYQVLRRSMLTARFTNLWGCDHIMLADLAYHGGFNRIPQDLYFALREPDEVRVESRMKRLTNLEQGEDIPAFMSAFFDRLRMLAPRDPMRPLVAAVARAQMEKRFTPERLGILAKGMVAMGAGKAMLKSVMSRLRSV